ncbi:hypothetical protein Clacol_002499 [Clathrus columnatus]|uniref:Ubiquitin carboxyl-terminal hydrolase n=1 Tax=Clathrus columnatus TaxID=1419009 RepID=A0AAV5A521_9AGAM|nr:hypothetical protein Clacol_002499 [Clathrus columnatus]
MLPTPNIPQQHNSQSPGSVKTIRSESSRPPSITLQEQADSSSNNSAGPSQCPHVEQILGRDLGAVGIIKAIVSWKYGRIYQRISSSKRRKLQAPQCGICSLSLHRPFVCLQCSFSGCWRDGHVLQHLTEENHMFCMDSSSGSVFCFVCDDFVYHSSLENAYTKAMLTIEEKNTRYQVGKRLREHYMPWIPNAEAITLLENTEPVPCYGRRGLLNLGQTCYLNVVLQALIHNPLLRNYFLSDAHNHRLCKFKDCVCCEMDKLFTEVYSSNTAPYGPTSLLASTWKASSELAGYAQQDAHECFISVLNQIHTNTRGSTNVSCNCIIHSTFSGQLQSDVKCGRCGNITTTIDPLSDISIELKGKGIEPGQKTLAACLRRYTHPEKLALKEYSCSKCGTDSHEATKRLSIRKLPPVLCFQLKRFEHNSTDKSAARKIDIPIRFPSVLNMLEYTTAAASRDDNGESETSGDIGPPAMYDYDLFAVINHDGQINNGHYTNFARYCDEWYRFDDDKPSYVVKRETEAVRAREREIEMEKEKEAARMREVEDALLATV